MIGAVLLLFFILLLAGSVLLHNWEVAQAKKPKKPPSAFVTFFTKIGTSIETFNEDFRNGDSITEPEDLIPDFLTPKMLK